MNATAIQSRPAPLNVLCYYIVSGEARVLLGRRIKGKVFVYDYPSGGDGRRYFVESGFDSKAELAVLLADYRRQAKRLGTCPMSHDAIERTFELAAPAQPAPVSASAGARTKEHR